MQEKSTPGASRPIWKKVHQVEEKSAPGAEDHMAPGAKRTHLKVHQVQEKSAPGTGKKVQRIIWKKCTRCKEKSAPGARKKSAPGAEDHLARGGNAIRE